MNPRIQACETQYYPSMRKWFAIIFLAFACPLAFAAIAPAVTKAYADSKGWVHIITADGRDHTIRPEKWQAGGGFEDVAIAKDGRTVGWLADQMLTPFEGATNYPYAVALDLDIWRDGRVIRKFPVPAFSIQKWIFLKGGNEVAFHVEPPHGQRSYDCLLFDINTGKELASWELDRKDYVVPRWAKPLLVDEDLPGPDEISNCFPSTPTPAKKAP
jgi:hypothetical protein